VDTVRKRPGCPAMRVGSRPAATDSRTGSSDTESSALDAGAVSLLCERNRCRAMPINKYVNSEYSTPAHVYIEDERIDTSSGAPARVSQAHDGAFYAGIWAAPCHACRKLIIVGILSNDPQVLLHKYSTHVLVSVGAGTPLAPTSVRATRPRCRFCCCALARPRIRSLVGWHQAASWSGSGSAVLQGTTLGRAAGLMGRGQIGLQNCIDTCGRRWPAEWLLPRSTRRHGSRPTAQRSTRMSQRLGQSRYAVVHAARMFAEQIHTSASSCRTGTRRGRA
jgi:hypothetical protein